MRKIEKLPAGANAKAIARRDREVEQIKQGTIDRAARRQATKEFVKAGSFYRSVLFHDPRNAFASNGLSAVLAQQGALQVLSLFILFRLLSSQ